VIASAVELSPETVRTLIAKTRAEREHDLATIKRLAKPAATSIAAEERAAQQRRALIQKWSLSVHDLDG
jgi:hypothetical protein